MKKLESIKDKIDYIEKAYHDLPPRTHIKVIIVILRLLSEEIEKLDEARDTDSSQ
jgi:hypothetical protein